jgi:hypothetical protein
MSIVNSSVVLFVMRQSTPLKRCLINGSRSLKEGRQSTLSQILRIFKKDVLPTLGKRAVGRLLTQPTID